MCSRDCVQIECHLPLAATLSMKDSLESFIKVPGINHQGSAFYSVQTNLQESLLFSNLLMVYSKVFSLDDPNGDCSSIKRKRVDIACQKSSTCSSVALE